MLSNMVNSLAMVSEERRIPRRDFAKALCEMLHDVQHDKLSFGQQLYCSLNLLTP